MKKFTFIVFFLVIVSAANAQEFKPFKVDLSTGYAIPSGKGAKGGILMVVEPKYSAIPNLAVGARFEIAVMARGSVSDQNMVDEVDVKASGSYLATADYYYPTKKIRPFSGAGTGIFSLATAMVDNNNAGASEAKSKFGGMVRSGVEIGHFRFGIEYNFVGDTDVMDASNNKIGTSKNSYLSIKIGAAIGGGKIK